MKYFGLFHLLIQLKVVKLSFHKNSLSYVKYQPEYFATQSDEKQAAA